MTRMLFLAALTLALCSHVQGSPNSVSNDPAPPIDAEGTIYTEPMSLPISQFVSPSFAQAYVKHATFAWKASRAGGVPAMGADKATWDQFDAAYDRNYAGPLLAANLAHYPINVLDTKIGGVRVGIVTPKAGVPTRNQGRVLINLHGGGFTVGRGLVSGQLESVPVAVLGAMRVITIDYRQAPYFKHPAASEDVEAVYRELLKAYQPGAIGIFGCSAGGVLAAQAIARLQAKDLPLPGAVGLFCASPLRFDKRGDSSMWGLSGIPVDPSQLRAASVWYMSDANPDDPDAYPGCCDDVLKRFPATLLLSGTRSSEMSAVVAAHARLLKLGVDASLYIMEGGWHGAIIDAVDTPEHHDAQAYIASWFDRHLSR